eukprot:3336529-Pyramimonas_sp.AAC.1
MTCLACSACVSWGQRELILPGGGDAQIQRPAGAARAPLQGAPRGHLVMVIDDSRMGEQVARRELQ